jgi:cysteinyl-tRNA synthetase
VLHAGVIAGKRRGSEKVHGPVRADEAAAGKGGTCHEQESQAGSEESRGQSSAHHAPPGSIRSDVWAGLLGARRYLASSGSLREALHPVPPLAAPAFDDRGLPSVPMDEKGSIPAEVQAAAEARAHARADQDWATADRLRAEIEAAGWRVIDRGKAFRLEAARPPDVEHGGEILYGRTDAVPSRLGEPDEGLASVILVVEPGDPATIDAVRANARHAPPEVDLVVVGDGIGDATAIGIRDALEQSALPESQRELVRTSAPLGRAAALNVGIRRARAATVVTIDPCIEPTDPYVAPLAAGLLDPTIAVAGPFGLVSADLRRFEAVPPPPDRPVDVAAVEGYLMAFRRADAVVRGPLDEDFRFYRNLDIWWSFVLRDEGEERTPRRAVALPDVPVLRREPHAWTARAPAERERLSKRNFYRLLDRFRGRADLAVTLP